MIARSTRSEPGSTSREEVLDDLGSRDLGLSSLAPCCIPTRETVLPLRSEDASRDPGRGEPSGDVASVASGALSRADRVRAAPLRAASPPPPPLGSRCPTQRPARHAPERNGRSPDFAY